MGYNKPQYSILSKKELLKDTTGFLFCLIRYNSCKLDLSYCPKRYISEPDPDPEPTE
jgi:hypothetical protein